MYGTGRAQIVAGRAQIVAGADAELAELAGYQYAGADPGPPGPPPGYGHPGMGHPGMHPGHGGHHGHHMHGHHPGYGPGGFYGDPGGMPIAATGPVAYDRTSRIRVIDERPTHERQFPIGFLSPQTIPVPANSTQTITATPQVIFRSERLAVPNSIVLNFQLVDIKVGKDSQLAAPGNLPTECFSNISIGVRMQLDTAEPGITLTLVAQNTDVNNPHPFSSVLYGTVVE